MAGAESSEKPVFSLRLLVDKRKSKVVLAEADKEFVDVLFSLLTLPMGTIVRLLEKYQQEQKSQAVAIGCFNVLYKSVVDLGVDYFLSEPCKDMLLYPRSVLDKQYRRLKLEIYDTAPKYYECPNVNSRSSCRRLFSHFCSSRCHCGELMVKVHYVRQNESGEIFISDKTLFTITDKMEVGFASMGLTLKTLKDLGYTDADQLQAMLVDVDHDKVLALLQCLFCSDTPLTDVFLTGRISHTKPSVSLQEAYAGTTEPNKVMLVSVFTRKVDKKVLYVKSRKDFVDLLFTFLALPLHSAWKVSGSKIVLGCIGNLCESYKSLSSSQWICRLPWYYSCHQPLLDVGYATREQAIQVILDLYGTHTDESMDPRYPVGSGFVKNGKTFMVSDGLNITPMNVTSNICQLKQWNIKLDDIEEQVININKTEAMRLLEASFMTSTALTTVFGSLLSKKPKEENL